MISTSTSRARFATLLLFGLLCCGCSYATSTWDTTKSIYHGYINTDPSLDLKKEGLSDEDAQKLAALFSPVDAQLGQALKVLGNMDAYPQQAWIDSSLNRFPWLSGVAVVGMDGTVLLQKPETPIKPFNIQPILGLTEEYNKRHIHSYIDRTDLGPELYMAQPFFRDNQLAGLVVYHCDPRSLAALSPDPSSLYLLNPDGLLWAGGQQPSDELVHAPWESLLQSKISGVIKAGDKQYPWLVRYVGGEPFIYAVQTSSTGHGGWWFW